jgi:hypothetical protein
MAVGWGGLIAAIGLLIGAERGDVARVAAIVVAFGIGGFLAGVRAEILRPLHSAIAAVAAYAFHAVFVVVGHVASILGGPSAPAFVPGATRTWLLTALLAVLVAMSGGIVAMTWLRPQRENRRRRGSDSRN